MLTTLGQLASIASGLFAELIAPSRCAACDAPVDSRILLCPSCAPSIERSPPERDTSLAIFEYGGAIASSIVRLKYDGRPEIGPRIGKAIVPFVSFLRRRVDIVVPVPLHPRRLAERGFNQALLIARPIARGLGVPISARGLLRVRDTPQQAMLDRARRLTNVRRSFRVNPRAQLEGQRVLLVDDVRTTGATLEACTAALHMGGAKAVFDLVVARRR